MGCGGSLDERRNSKYSENSSAAAVVSTKSKKVTANGTSSPKPLSSCQLDVNLNTEVLADSSTFITVRVLGRGSFALIREVREKDKEKRYVMKVLPKDTRKLTEAKKTYMNMLNASKKMKHPFIASFVCAQQTRSSLRLVIELADKGDMRNVLRNVKREGFSDQMLRFYCAQLVCAIEHMHSQGIIHRNIKPEAYLLDSSGFCKLSSFIYAKSVDNGCKTYTLCGTPEYISPEILFNKGHGKPTDWWSFGVLVYELLCGSPPFVADEPSEVYRQIMAGRFKFRKETPVSVRAFIGGLLRRDVSTRLGSQDGADEISIQAFWGGMSWQEILDSKVPANCEVLNTAAIPPIVSVHEDGPDEMDWKQVPESSDPFKHTFGAFVDYSPTDYTRAASLAKTNTFNNSSASLTKSSTTLADEKKKSLVIEADVKVAYTQFISSNNSERVSVGTEEATPPMEASANNSSSAVEENPVPEADVVEANKQPISSNISASVTNNSAHMVKESPETVVSNSPDDGKEEPIIEADVGEANGQSITSQTCGGTLAEEKKIDPEDGKPCTYEELCAKYCDIYKPEDIEAYWKDECKRNPEDST